MSRSFQNAEKEFERWILATGVAAVAFFVTLYLSLFLLVFSRFPKDLAEPLTGFLMGFNVVLAGSLLAPRNQIAFALMLLVSMTAIAALFGLNCFGTVAGGLAAFALSSWWFHPRRTTRSFIWVGMAAFAAISTFVAAAYARFVDKTAVPEALSPVLVNVLSTNSPLVSAFYRYDLGGFIDHQWLWRIDGPPEAVALVVSGLSLSSTNVVPQDFWKMPPHYWPRAMPENGGAYNSPFFSGESRGADGSHYFLVHDKARNQAFVWVKDNL